MTFTIQNVAEVKKKFRELAKKVKRAHRGVLQTVGNGIKKETKRLAPKKTGALRRSIKSSNRAYRGEQVYRVGPRIHYAKFHEFGYGPYTAQPFLRPALSDSMRRLSTQKYRRLVKEQIKP